MATEVAAKPKRVLPVSDLYELQDWAKANRIGENAAYEYCRREIDPMPHIKQGVRYLVEPGPASEWIRRKFGVGYGGQK
jgi:hypothetical protein